MMDRAGFAPTSKRGRRTAWRCAARRAAAVVAAHVLFGCASAPPYQRPAIEVPSQWQVREAPSSPAAPAEPLVWDRWWPAFGGDELNRLVDAALTGNHDLAAAQQRVLQARALVDVSAAASGLQVQGVADAARMRRSGSTGTTALGLGAEASIDVDWNGATARAVDAATGRLQQREFARESIGATLLVDLAENYFRAASALDRLEIARANIANAESLLNLLASRQQAGALTSLDLVRQQGLIASLRAGVPALAQQRETALRAVAVLTGRSQLDRVQAGSLTTMHLPRLAADLPAQLLERHPDVRQAEAELVISHADVNAARNAWLPKLRLDAAGALESATLAGLFNGAGVVTSLGASLVAPLIDGGRIRAQLAAATARRDEVHHLYRQAVLNALRDVEDRTAALRALAEQADQQQHVVEFAQTSLKLADLRYRNGATDYVTVLDAQRVLLAAQDAQAVLHLSRYSQTLGLVRALGGGVPATARGATLAAHLSTPR